MKKTIYTLLLLIAGTVSSSAEPVTLNSPDGKLTVKIDDTNEQLTYSVSYEGKEMLRTSRLGILTEMGDYTQQVKITNTRQRKVSTSYTMTGTKTSGNNYEANALDLEVTARNVSRPMTVEMQVSNNNIAYRYHLKAQKPMTVTSLVAPLY